MSAVFFKLATSKAGIVVILGLVLFAWHKLDKTSAVRGAVVGYVADVELTAARAELAEQRRLWAAANTANRLLHADIALAEAAAEAANLELETYVSTVDDVCRVDGPILERLRNR